MVEVDLELAIFSSLFLVVDFEFCKILLESTDLESGSR